MKIKVNSKIDIITEDILFNNLLSLNAHNYTNLYFINDTLDTTKEEIKTIKDFNFKIINIEDQGSGAEFANLVINALYQKSTNNSNEFNGPKFNIFRNEFYAESKCLIDKKDSKKILISFGGTDPAKLTELTIGFLLKMGIRNLSVIDPPHRKIRVDEYSKWIIKDNVNVAAEINKSQFVISSGGRTVYEANFLKTQSLVICQNKRELSHYCLTLDSVTNLGLHSEVTFQQFENSIQSLRSQNNNLYLDKWLSKKEILDLILS